VLVPDVGPGVGGSVWLDAVVGDDAAVVLDVGVAAACTVNEKVPETGWPSAEVTRHVTV
jgi:hypothetical protein